MTPFMCPVAVKRQIGLYSSRDEESGGGLGLLVSVLIHVALITTVLVNAPAEEAPEQKQLTYVELAPQMPRVVPDGSNRVIEAPGPESSARPRQDAPLSDADRRSSSPRPSGDRQADRPGIVDAPFIPGSPAPGPPPAPPSPPAQSRPEAAGEAGEPSPESAREGFRFEERSGREAPKTVNGPEIDWSSAIEQAGKVASLGGRDLGNYGGEKGFAESGPISFETQWYEWGDYATSMIRRIRYHWYNNMPALVRMGVKGVVVIRFTIQRDGSITEIEILQGSTHPPFDFAAKKALELSSPLQPLPADFPKQTERVTAAFYYNLRPPTD